MGMGMERTRRSAVYDRIRRTADFAGDRNSLHRGSILLWDFDESGHGRDWFLAGAECITV